MKKSFKATMIGVGIVIAFGGVFLRYCLPAMVTIRDPLSILVIGVGAMFLFLIGLWTTIWAIAGL